MNNINHVVLSGNATKDSELRYNNSGAPSLRINFATNETYLDKVANEYKEYPNYFLAHVYGKRAEYLAEKIKKGVKVTIAGRLKQNRWKDENGDPHSLVYVIANDIEYYDYNRNRTVVDAGYNDMEYAGYEEEDQY